MDLFEKRVNLKPFEYPELSQFKDAIRHSYWVHTEYNLTQDVQDFHTQITPAERTAIKNTMLAIAQIEIEVKTFWGDLYSHAPKPEVGQVGYTFAESEVRHQDAYAHLIEILGLNEEFKTVKDIPAIQDRVAYLSRYVAGAKSRNSEDYMMSLLLFSVFIEHVSLFSQFLIMMSFGKYKNTFKGIANIVQATSKEEQIHGLFGIQLIQITKREHPEWFDDAFKAKVIRACRKAYNAETKVLNWIFEDGPLDFLPVATIEAFIQDRFNRSLNAVGIDSIFDVDMEALSSVSWFDEEVLSTSHTDFFSGRPTTYTKFTQAVTADDLF